MGWTGCWAQPVWGTGERCPLLAACLEAVFAACGLFNREAGMLLASCEVFGTAAGCHYKHQGWAREVQEAVPIRSFSSPLNDLQTPISLSCMFLGSGFHPTLWECQGGSGLASIWGSVTLGSVITSEPQVPLYQ